LQFLNTLVVFETDEGGNYQAKWIFRLDEGRILGQKMVDMLLCPPYMVAFNSGIEVSEERLLKKAKEIQENHSQYALTDISAIFEEFCELYYAYYRLGAFTEPTQWYTEYLLSNYLHKHYKGDLAPTDALKLLLVTEHDSFTVDILRDMRECAKALDDVVLNNPNIRSFIENTIHEDGAASRIATVILESQSSSGIDVLVKKLTAHSAQFHWKNNNYYSTCYVAPMDVLVELLDPHHFAVGKVFAYYDGLLSVISEQKKKQLEEKAVVFARLPSYYQNIVSIANNVGATLIDQRKKNVMTCNSAFDILFSIIAKATGAIIEDLHLLIPQELKYYIREPAAYKERFEQRKNLFICLQSDFPLADELIEPVDVSSPESVLAWKVTQTTEPFIAEGTVAAQVLDKLNLRMNLYETDSDASKKLQGVTAFYNPDVTVIEGIVHVIKNPKTEILNSGEILVAPSTTPDYINAINKSVTIITDWGGQTSHAAIVSRELKKPCVIGTNFASQVLKTGQRVRINFTQGTIEVIR
jgi:phosphohistidine swiveling domain-containing protein